MTRLPAPICPRPILLAALALGLAGCGEVKILLEADLVVQQRLDYQPGVSEIYCYRTLAAVDCYGAPQPGPPNRLVNAYDNLEGE
jgi:hypothetical protein